MENKSFFDRYDTLLKQKGIPVAEKYALASLQEANQLGDKILFVSIANELGGLYRVTGRFKAGKIVYDAALTTLQELGLQESVQYATTLINFASVCCEEKKYDEAIIHYLQAEKIYACSAEASAYQKAALFNNISSALGAQEKYVLALEYAQKALEIIEKQEKAFTETATTHTTLGSLYLRMNDYKTAEEHLLKAQQIFTQRSGMEPNIHYSQTLNALGELYFAQQKYDKAKQVYEKALLMIKETYGETTPVAIRITDKLKKIEQLSKNGVNALDLFTKAFKKSSERIEYSDESSCGLSLCEKYYYRFGKPMLEQKFPEYLQYIAAGLVGEGSECLSFDDEFSQDHDFGPGFCIWLPTTIYDKIGRQMQECYNGLPQKFLGYERKNTSEGEHRVGVFSIENFYHNYVGKLPKSNIDWLALSASHILTAVNGKVFEDFYGEFTKIREALLQFYPKDVWLKKLAASLFKLSQAGQYNYRRCVKRKDTGAAYMTCSEFVREVLSTVYLLNCTYMPYYKWSFRGLNNLERLPEVREMLQELITTPDTAQAGEEKIEQINQICQLIKQELLAQELSTISNDFLVDHSFEIMKKIIDPQLRQLPVMFDLGK